MSRGYIWQGSYALSQGRRWIAREQAQARGKGTRLNPVITAQFIGALPNHLLEVSPLDSVTPGIMFLTHHFEEHIQIIASGIFLLAFLLEVVGG
jgi:hypothetical protein